MLARIEIQPGAYAFTAGKEGSIAPILYTHQIGHDVVLIMYEPAGRQAMMARQLALEALPEIYHQWHEYAKESQTVEVHFVGGEDFSAVTEKLYQQEDPEKRKEYIQSHPAKAYCQKVIEALRDLAGGEAEILQERGVLQIRSGALTWKIVAMDIVEQPHEESLYLHPACSRFNQGMYEIVQPLEEEKDWSGVEARILQQEKIRQQAATQYQLFKQGKIASLKRPISAREEEVRQKKMRQEQVEQLAQTEVSQVSPQLRTVEEVELFIQILKQGLLHTQQASAIHSITQPR